jgi:hypothetical protein
MFHQVRSDFSIFLFKKTNVFFLVFKGISEIPLPAFYGMSERPSTADFGYNPSLILVHQFILPDDLPELDNYATFGDNTVIDWTKQQMTSIAPSFAIPMLPDINELSSSTTPAPSVQPQIAIGKDLFYINSNKHNLNNFFI